MSESVTFAVGDDHVGVVTLHRPGKLNAMDVGVFEGLHDAAGEAAVAAGRGECRAVLVTGEGRAFSAGLDVSLFAGFARTTREDGLDRHISWLQQAFTAFEDLAVPTVAAVKGVALGAGCQLAVACHLRLAAADLLIGVREARWALVPDLGGTYRLPRLLGLSRAIDLAVSGRDLDAGTALSWGLVDAVFDAEHFEEQARAYTAGLAAGATVATGAVPGLMRRGLERTRAEALAAERQAQEACLSSADFAEAMAAASHGREPRFRGHS